MSTTDKLNAFLQMLEQGQDGPLLRYSIGLEYLHAGDPAQAAEHLRRCLEQDPGYSAAYKSLALAQDDLEEGEGCRATLEQGVARAQERGDMQAKKEMEVLLKRLDKGQPLQKR